MHHDDPVFHSRLSPLLFLERNRDVYADKAAVVHGDTIYTFHEFGQRVDRLAAALRRAGLQNGERVAFLAPNIPSMLEAHFAVPAAGGVLVAINTRLAPQEIGYILNHSGARFLFVDRELTNLVRPVRHDLPELAQVVEIIDGGDDVAQTEFGDVDYDSFIARETRQPTDGGVAPRLPLPADEEDVITINYTSGTTGRPKGVMYTHRGAYLNSLGEIYETQLEASSVYLWTLPMFHCNGWCFTWGTIASGATSICLRKFDPETVWQLIEKHGVTHFNGAPVVMSSLLNDPGRPQTLSRPLTVTVAGAPPSPTLIENMRSLNARVVHVYGLTETYGPHTVCAPQDHWDDLNPPEQARLRARQGVSYVATEPVRVVDEELRDVPPDGETMGEVIMRGNNVMKGYHDDPEATAAAFRGGWFHSGDLAVMHKDGYIELRDRSKDIIITGGENVSSIEVEQTLYRHPDVLEVAVIGIPHTKWGETPKAFVTLKSGAGDLTENALIDFCRSQLAHYKCPTCIEFGDLPKTSTGKIQKFVLREREWAGREKRIQG